MGKITEFIEKQGVAKARYDAALEKKKEDEDIMQQRRFEKEQAARRARIGELTKEEKEYLARKQARDKERREKYIQAGKTVGSGVLSTGKSIYKFLEEKPSRPRRSRRRRMRY